MRELNASFLESVKAALESLDADRLISHYVDDAVFLDSSLGDSWSLRGREKLMTYFKELFSLSGVKFQVTSIFGCGEWAAAEWIWSGTRRGGDGGFRVKGASIIQIRDGKIGRETIYYDSRSGPS